LPYRITQIDTATGADTVAPASPAGLIFSGSFNSCIILWTAVAADEDSGALTGLNGYKVFRVHSSGCRANGDTDNWEALLIAVLNFSDTSYFDSGLINGDTYYYRVTAFDTHISGGTTFINQSWYSSIASGFPTVPVYTGPNWYVNAFTGGDTAGKCNGSETYPFKTISKALSLAASGDTIFAADGIYNENVNINLNNFALIGQSRENTIINAGGTTLYAGQDKSNVTIKNFKITGSNIAFMPQHLHNSTFDSLWIYTPASHAILLEQQAGPANENCKFTNIRVDTAGGFCVYVAGGQNTNDTFINCEFYNGNSLGLYNEGSNFYIENCVFDGINGYGYCYGTNTILKNNVFRNMRNGNPGALLAGSNHFVSNNLFDSNTGPGIILDNAINSTTDSAAIKNKIASSGGGAIIHTPFRTTMIDTLINADTVSPAAPLFIDADTSVLKQVIIRWTKPVLDENGGILSGLNGYRLYRAAAMQTKSNGDTDNWEAFLIAEINNPNDTSYIDTGFAATGIYYYKIIAFDSHLTNGQLFYNRCWYSTGLQVFARYNSAPETPVLISPVNLPAPYSDFANYGRTLNPRPNLIWLCPIDIDSNTLHFKVYCDSFQGNTLFANSAVDTNGFYYYKNGNYETFTLNGVDSNVYGNTIYYKPQINLNDSIYIWTVLANDSELNGTSPATSRFQIGGRIWTDSEITAYVTLIRKAHIDELREEINFARKLRGLPNFSWTDPIITSGKTIIRKIYIDELRQAHEELSVYSIEPLPVWYGTIIAGETIIKKIYFEELRDRLKK